MGFGENLRNGRKRLRLTQQDLGILLGKSKNNISQYEHNAREPDITALMKIAQILGLSTDELLFGVHQSGEKIPFLTGMSSRRRPRHWPRRFYFLVFDDSLAERRILSGDRVLIVNDRQVQNGDIVLATVGQALLLRIYERDAQQAFIALDAANSAFTRVLAKPAEFVCHGRAVFSILSLDKSLPRVVD